MAEVRTLAEEPDTRRAFRRFWPHVRPHLPIVAPALVVSLLATAADVFVAPAIGRGVDAVVGGDGRGLLFWGCTVVVLVLAQMVLLRGAERLLARAGEKVVRSLRDHAVEGLAAAPLRFVEAHRTGDLLRRSTGEIADLAAFVRQQVPDLLSVGATLVLTLVVLLAYSWLLTLVLLVVFVPAAALVVRWFKKDADIAYGRRAAAESAFTAGFSETVTAHDTLAGANALPRREEALRTEVDAVRRATYGANAVQTRLVGTTLVEGLATATLLVVGVLLVSRGQVTIGAVVTFVLATRNLFNGFRALSDLVGELQTARIGLARLLDLFDAATPHLEGGPEARDLPAAGELLVEDVRYGYTADGPVLHGLSLRIRQGERLGLVGETGSGKTTLAKLLGGLYLPDAGVVRFAGVDLREVAPDDRRARIAVVPQVVHTVDGTIADNLTLLPSEPDRAALEAAVDLLGVRDWIDGLPDGLDTRVGRSGRALSAGEQQLIGLVRAALTDPAVLVLDEATSDLDPTLARRLEVAVEALRPETTIVVVAHRAATIERLPRVVTLDAGRVVSDQ